MNVSYVGRYVGLVQNRIKNMSLLTIGVNLVRANLPGSKKIGAGTDQKGRSVAANVE